MEPASHIDAAFLILACALTGGAAVAGVEGTGRPARAAAWALGALATLAFVGAALTFTGASAQ